MQILIILAIVLQACSRVNYLESSLKLYGENNREQLLKYDFKEKLNVLGHLSQPWETHAYEGKGTFWASKNTFQKEDSLKSSNGKVYTSKIDLTNDTLLFLDYGNDALLPITEELFFEKYINTSRYTPLPLLNYFKDNKDKVHWNTTKDHVVYSLNIGSFSTYLFINRSNYLVDKITYLSYDQLYGDVTTSFKYSLYTKNNIHTFPSRIKIEKMNGKVIDEVEILSSTINNNSLVELIKKPKNYQLVKLGDEHIPQVTTTKYNDYIYFVDLAHTDDKVLVVEFEDYMLVAEAPLSSNNGELIISEVKKIAPLKPIKYFVFGHHHPHYLGGLRAFVHKNTIILCTDISRDYVEYIAKAPHTIKPDSLQLQPKPVKTQIIKDSLTIGKTHKMKIYFMGEKSSHTKDYLIYYFPNNKLLFQDDLCWIPKEGIIKKARPREIGLYNTIKDLGLEVDTIIQSWPVKSHQVKTVIPFTDLEKAIKNK
ncbi:hypothetical protein [Tenacibaculum sp.]|uniref:hypothetical protein n=1 Tax=Tenacibaculum sp. TaxID=1906242 RepID=UPI003AA9BF27